MSVGCSQAKDVCRASSYRSLPRCVIMIWVWKSSPSILNPPRFEIELLNPKPL